MNTNRISFILTIFVSLALLLGACAPAATPEPTAVPTTVPTAVPTEAAKPIKIALILSGPISDASYNAYAYNTVVGLKDKYNIDLQYTENVGLPDIEPAYRSYADQGFDVIIGNGFQFGDPAVKIADEYPNTKWGIIDGIVSAPNVESLNFSGEEQGYVAGVLAAMMSKTGIIGGVGGEQVPSIVNVLEALKLGAKSVNPDIKILNTYVGSWIDPTAGMEAANAQINNGADIIYTVANLTSTGVYQAAKEKGIMAIGTEGDQCGVAPGTVVASQTQNIGPVLEFMMSDIANGTFKGAVNYYGYKVGAMSVIYCEGQVPTDIQAKVNDVMQQIIDGKIDIPVTLEPTD